MRFLTQSVPSLHARWIVTTLHGTDITVLGYDPSLKELIKFGIEQSDAVTAVSDALVKQTFDLIAPDKEIETIYNFIDERVYRKADASLLKQEYGIAEEEKVIIHVSNFRPVKRVRDIVAAFAKISDRIPSKLLLVGDGPEMTLVCSLVEELGLTGRVLLLGKQEKVEELYAISDLVMLLSEKESFGLVLLEANACGVPAIGTNIGGIPEVIIAGETDYIEAAAEKAVKLLKDPSLHKRFSDAAMKLAGDKFASARITAEYEAIYDRLLEN